MPFAKGKSGNPGGRPKIAPDVQELLNDLTPEAISTLAFIMRDVTAQASSRVTAAMAILKKTLPDLGSVEHKGEVTTSFVIRAPEVLTADEWQKQYSPTLISH